MINELKKEIEKAKTCFLEDLNIIQSSKELIQIKDNYLSRKKGIVTEFMKQIKNLSAEDKPLAGKLINEFKVEVEKQLNLIHDRLSYGKKNEIDYSLPAFDIPVGSPHLLSIVRTALENIFLEMGYEITHGPEVETEYNNFTALNMQEGHPARNEQDTFFIKGYSDILLRTHTSPVQIRYM
ncbi:MAG: phenylalanine--tRNA ligase subunit alpha, partial [Candidatus Aminicenantes bacterium]|nr:phenylalanine--tRNA ligase subunit alpha [Candidatus Aminicenantes bacterium]